MAKAKRPVAKARRRTRPTVKRERYGAAARLLAIRAMLARPGGTTLDAIVERFDCGRHTAMRSIAALEAMGEPVEEERDGRRNVYRLAGDRDAKAKKTSTMHLLALAVARQLVRFLQGTLLEEAFEEVVQRLANALDGRAFAQLEALSKQVLVVPDAPWEPVDRADVVDALVTALVKREKVTLRAKGPGGTRKPFAFEPYTLLVLKQGLYVAGHSDHHGSVRLYGLDKIVDADWERGAAFEVPDSWDAEARYGSPFDLFDGPPTQVKIAFSPKVARYVTRRRWHPSQRIEEHADGGVVLTMTVRGTTLIVSWLLGFGDEAEALVPQSLRDELAAVTSRMAATYAPTP